MSIGTNIYTLRKSKKITQGQLAEKLGVSEQAVSKWENDVCSPDVSLFPVIAEFFGVSIDRLFGFYRRSYEDEVNAIIKAADDSMDTYKEIEIISEGLSRYPNSASLKTYLAFSLSMVNRMSKDPEERKNAVEKAIKLCTEVVDTSGDTKEIDSALSMLMRIYNETGNYEKSADAIEKMSATAYGARIIGKTHMLGLKKSYAEQEAYAQESLWSLYHTASRVFECLTSAAMEKKEFTKAIDIIDAHEKLLSVFDKGCPDFYATYKIWAKASKAKTYMKMGDKENCLSALSGFIDEARKVKKAAKSEDFNIAARNPMYFGSISDPIYEEYMSNIFPLRMLSGFEAFFEDDENFAKLKSEAEKI